MPEYTQPTLPGLPALLTSTEVADALRVSESRLRHMRTQGEGPAFIKLPNGAVRYTVEAVQAWISGEAR